MRIDRTVRVHCEGHHLHNKIGQIVKKIVNKEAGLDMAVLAVYDDQFEHIVVPIKYLSKDLEAKD